MIATEEFWTRQIYGPFNILDFSIPNLKLVVTWQVFLLCSRRFNCWSRANGWLTRTCDLGWTPA